MPIDSPSEPERGKKRYAQDIFENLPEVEMGVDIPRVFATRLTTGKNTKLRLSAAERLGRDGWDVKSLTGAKVGSVVIHQTGEVFEVVEVKKGRMRIRNSETGHEGEIVADSVNIAAQEYGYNLRAGLKYSKKIKVYDTVYKDRSLDTTDFIDAVVQSVPEGCIDVFDEIEIHKMSSDTTGTFRAEPSLISQRRVLNLYVSEEFFFKEGGYPTKAVVETLYHELGHAIAKYLKGNVNPGIRWRKTMVADGFTLSEYAEKKRYPKQNDEGEIEDFAEAVRLYLATDGSKTNQTSNLREFCRNRFKKLDEVFEDLSAGQKAGLVQSLKRRLFKSNSSLE